MRIYIFFALLIFLNSCNYKTESQPISNSNSNNIKESIDDRINKYLANYEIEPSDIVNNTDGNKTTIKLSEHKIEWINNEYKNSIRIDNHIISIDDKVTINNVWDERTDSVSFINSWNQIKLFKYNNREIIGVRMNFQPCTGLGCSVDYFLIYDLTTKTENYFGTFRTDNEIKLYNFNNDDRIDYVSKTFNGDAHGSTAMEYVYKLYSLDKNGNFLIMKDSDGLIYSFRHVTFPNDSTENDKFIQHWIEKIK